MKGETMPAIRYWVTQLKDDDRGLNTAELMGNAALAIAALVVIWGALQALGVDLVGWIRGTLIGG
jgi:hypothetical protein